MAQPNETAPVKKTMADIAAMMTANREKMRAGKPETQSARLKEKQESTQLGIEEVDTALTELLDEDANDGTPEDEKVKEDLHDEEAGEGLEEEEEDGDEGEIEEGGDEDLAAGTYDDGDLLEIEGVDEPVSLKELKEVYTADKTVAERLKSTEAEYLTATQTRAQALQESTKMQEAMQALVKSVDSILNQPLVSAPDEALADRDPSQYVRHKRAYDQDQKRIADSQKAVLDALSAHSNSVKESSEARRASEINLLAQKIPALRDEKARGPVSKDILDSAAHYGFTNEEIKTLFDHRAYQMAYDAAQYNKLKNAKSTPGKVEEMKEKVANKPRVLRSKNTTSSRLATSAQKEAKAAHARAKQSGKPEDAAAYMAAKRRTT